MENYIFELRKAYRDYKKIVSNFESKGINNLNSSQRECYVFYLGKCYLLMEIINKLKSF